jgi:Lrp/AsnC family leucine-responsive transcriptional regulator
VLNSVIVASDRTIDEIDGSLLDILQYNARTTQAELAKAVGLAPSAVLERLRKLEAKGIIRDYVALIDPHVVDRGLLAFVAVRSTEHGPEMPLAIELSRIPEVLEVHHVAGDDCYLLKVRARDAEHLGQLLRQQISAVPAVTSTRTTIVLETVKEDPRVSIPKDKTLPELQR